INRPLGVCKRTAELAGRHLLQPPASLTQRIAFHIHLLVEDQPAVLVDPADALDRRALLLAEQFLEHALALGRAGEESDRVERFGALRRRASRKDKRDGT